jgi:hypothetical protein
MMKMGHMAGLIEKTQGDGVRGVLSGVLMHTKPMAARKVVDNVMKSSGPRPKTIPRTLGQVPFAGKKY